MQKVKHIYLSRFMRNNMPCYNGGNNFCLVQVNSIGEGNRTNSLQISTANHVGTHIDFPSHYIANGKSLSDYSPSFFVFENPFICDIPMQNGEYITANHLMRSSISDKTDILIIRTGYGVFYNQDKYWNDNPGIDESAAKYIKSSFASIRAIGVDFISINAYRDKEAGRQAHIAFLSDPEVLIIEDLYIPSKNYNYSRITIAPMLIADADGAPCAIIAEIE
ncbi:MAG: cyclase family protein [Helicobacteraceae bacterium]|jgi:kynurenine formamidase|nr:cyclase family protein [Helicobacteraceae bacterium]